MQDRNVSARSLFEEVLSSLSRSTVAAFLVAAIAIAFGASSAESHDVRVGAHAGTGLPTHAELEAATERFLRAHPGSASEPAARARGPIVVTPVFPATRIVSFYGAP